MSTKLRREDQDSVDQALQEMEEVAIQNKIVHILKIYPIISPTMLQSGLGPYVKPALWRPVLAKLIEDGTVIEDQKSLYTPSDRYNTYTLLSLANREELVS